MKKSVSRNDEDSQSGKFHLWMEDAKTLSKNLLYAPMVAYHKSAIDTRDHDSNNSSPSKTEHPSQYLSNRNSVPNSLKESSLVSILHFVSCDYHRNRATVNDAKNNGSRPLGLSDVEDRIRQRAVTLVGGGIDTSIPIVKTALRSKKRRYRSWEKVEPVLKKLSLEEVILESESSHAISFLQKLNTVWNQYMWKLFVNDKGKIEKDQMTDNDLKEFEVRFGALVSRIDNRKKRNSIGGNKKSGSNVIEIGNAKDGLIDLVGAHLKIDSSNSHTSWVGRFGVLIGETTNTYRIASYARRQKKKNSNTKESWQKKKHKQNQFRCDSKFEERPPRSGVEKSTSDFEQGTRNRNIEILVLPKLGSSLHLILPFLISDLNQVGVNKDQILDSDGINLESMITVPDEAIVISIRDQKQML